MHFQANEKKKKCQGANTKAGVAEGNAPCCGSGNNKNIRNEGMREEMHVLATGTVVKLNTQQDAAASFTLLMVMQGLLQLCCFHLH
jgi:hypothetical protein